MSKRVALSEPYIKGREWKFVKECLDTGWVSSAGKFVERFENDIYRYTKAKHTVALSCGTAALHMALKVIGVRPGDEIIVPTVTFIAPVNVVTYVGARPIFMDCDEYYNIDSEKTIEFIKKETIFRNGFTVNKRTKKRITAMIVVHVFGNAVNLAPMVSLCKKRNIRLIEDATESLGTVYKNGRYKGKHAGTIGDIGCLSFNGNKIITTGGGGMLLTANSTFAKRARYLSTQAKDDPIFSVHGDIGYNYRLTNVQSAIGIAQLKNLSVIKKKRSQNYRSYKKKLKSIPGLKLADVPSYASNNYWMCAVQVDRKKYGVGVRKLVKTFLKNKIEVRPLWQLNHLQKPFKGCQTFKINRAKGMLNSTLNIPSSATLTQGEINRVVKLLKQLGKN